MKREQFLREINEDLEFDEGQFRPGVNLQDLPEWDSMQRLVFIAKTQEKTGAVLEGPSVANAKTADDLLALLSDVLE